MTLPSATGHVLQLLTAGFGTKQTYDDNAGDVRYWARAVMRWRKARVFSRSIISFCESNPRPI
jgi:hypothetical protein